MEEVIDVTSSAVVPYLIHFSKLGISSNVVEVDSCEIKMRKVLGPRLGELLNGGLKVFDLEGIYERMGHHVGVMSKYAVGHNDLHIENVIIENGIPVIIDWENAKVGYTDDRLDFLQDTEMSLISRGFGKEFAKLKNSFDIAFDREMKKPMITTPEEIHRKAYQEFRFT